MALYLKCSFKFIYTMWSHLNPPQYFCTAVMDNFSYISWYWEQVRLHLTMYLFSLLYKLQAVELEVSDAAFTGALRLRASVWVFPPNIPLLTASPLILCSRFILQVSFVFASFLSVFIVPLSFYFCSVSLPRSSGLFSDTSYLSHTDVSNLPRSFSNFLVTSPLKFLRSLFKLASVVWWKWWNLSLFLS